jgi:hypothetical protein
MTGLEIYAFETDIAEDCLEYISPQSKKLKYRLFLKPIFLVKLEEENSFAYPSYRLVFAYQPGLLNSNNICLRQRR